LASDWRASVDGYCERLEPGFWAEPVNAVTNLSFILAVALAFRSTSRDRTLDPAVRVLLALVLAIGIGSFLFHTFATRWAALADTTPIALFILIYLALIVRRGFGWGWTWTILIGIAFLPVSVVITSGTRVATGGLLGGSSGYLPALGALIVCGLLLLRSNEAAGQALLKAAGLFLISLTFRTLDQPLCNLVPLGTHFVWHILNGILLGYLVVAMARMHPKQSQKHLRDSV
jgi:hypothetical protein